MKKLKKIILLVFTVLIMFVLNSCSNFFNKLSYWENYNEIREALHCSCVQNCFVGQEVDFSISLFFSMNDDIWISYIKDLPTSTLENISILEGTKNETHTQENYFCINMVADENGDPISTISLIFNEPGEYLIYFGVIKLDEDGNKIQDVINKLPHKINVSYKSNF